MTKTPNPDFHVQIAPNNIYHETANDPAARGPYSRAVQLRALIELLIRAEDTNMNMSNRFSTEECYQVMFQLADELAYDLEKRGLDPRINS